MTPARACEFDPCEGRKLTTFKDYSEMVSEEYHIVCKALENGDSRSSAAIAVYLTEILPQAMRLPAPPSGSLM